MSVQALHRSNTHSCTASPDSGGRESWAGGGKTGLEGRRDGGSGRKEGRGKGGREGKLDRGREEGGVDSSAGWREG